MPQRLLTILILAAAMTGCTTWVKLEEGAESIRLAEAADVAQCEKVGKTTVSVQDRVGWYQPRPKQMEEELANLARNSALETGGDTIVADSPVDDGRQRFSVYRCLR